MPEWLTHVLFAWILFEVIQLKFGLKNRYLPVILIGAVLPDIENFFALLIGDSAVVLNPSLHFIVSHGIAHTPVILLPALFVASFWKKDFKPVFLLISIGAVSHLLLDTISTASGIMWLWPLSWNRFGLSLCLNDWMFLPFVMLFWLGIIKFLKGDFNFVAEK